MKKDSNTIRVMGWTDTIGRTKQPDSTPQGSQPEPVEMVDIDEINAMRTVAALLVPRTLFDIAANVAAVLDFMNTLPAGAQMHSNAMKAELAKAYAADDMRQVADAIRAEAHNLSNLADYLDGIPYTGDGSYKIFNKPITKDETIIKQRINALYHPINFNGTIGKGAIQ